MTRLRRPAARLLLSVVAPSLALGLVLTGCGSDDTDDAGPGTSTSTSTSTDGATDSTPTSPPSTATTPSGPLSKADFVDQANKICKVGNTVINASTRDLDIKDDAVVKQLVLDTLVPGVRQQISAIRDLGAPEGDEQEVADALAAGDAALDELEANPELIQDGEVFTKANKALDAYGLTACGAGG